MFKKLIAGAALAVLLCTSALATIFTTPTFLASDQYVDLGSGPADVQVTGPYGASIIVADTKPAATSRGQQMTANSPVRTFCQTSHIWGIGLGVSSTVNVTPTACAGAGNIAAADPANAAFAGSVPMTVGTVYAPLRSVRVVATVAGNVVFQFPDGSTIPEPVQVGAQTFPYAVTQIVSAGTTAVATFYSLK